MLPELDKEGWTTDDFVRDMPVDYTLLIENLLDPGRYRAAIILLALDACFHSTRINVNLPDPGGSVCYSHTVGIERMLQIAPLSLRACLTQLGVFVAVILASHTESNGLHPRH